MSIPARPIRLLANSLALGAALLLPLSASAQGREQGPLQQAQQLDRDGAFAEAHPIFQSIIDAAEGPRELAAAQRRMAMHYGFMGDCANAVAYEEMVISYWVTQEDVDPQDAFYQEGEMANEAARVCVDSGDLGTAERMYRRGYMLGNLEPEP